MVVKGGIDLKYNILIITPDQLRSDYLGCYGNKDVRTENIDRLSQEGMTFENCYCASPLCGPSRISFATSTYFSEHNHRNYWSTVSPNVPNIVTSLKRAGYKTGMFGKNHLFTYDRLNEVWDCLDEICLGNYDGHPDYKHSFSAFTMNPEHPFNITGRLTSETIEFMAQADRPFIAWVNYQDPHPAFTCPPPYDTMFNPDDIKLPVGYRDYDRNSLPVRNEVWRKHSEMDMCTDDEMKKAIAHYMGQIKYVDDSVGKMMDFIEESGLSENTVVLFFSDHGELLGDYGMTHKLPAFYDCLTKIPVIIRHPGGRWQNQRFGGLVEEVDLAPTILEILGVEIPKTMVGRSWVEQMNKGDFTGRDSILCEAGGGAPTCREPIEGFKLVAPHMPTSFGPGAMLREGAFKLSIYADDKCELYNLDDDPHELNNLYNNESYLKIQTDMTLKLLKRVLGVKIRDTGLEWDYPPYTHDVRFEPLENC